MDSLIYIEFKLIKVLSGLIVNNIKLKTSSIENITSNIKKFEFVDAKGGSLPEFTAGSHVDFELGNGLVRSYSLAGNPDETSKYTTAILRELDGDGGSRFMHDNVSVGDELSVKPPVNNFQLSPEATRHILLGGGIGITPLLSMGHKLASDSSDRYLHYCTKSVADTAFIDEVKVLFGENMTFYHDGGNPGDGIDLVNTFLERPDGAHIYICGPSGLITAAREATSHWPIGTVHFELFKSTKEEKDENKDQSESENKEFQIELAKTGKVLTVPPDKSMLEVLWENDIDVMHACEEGWCGNCVVDYLGGEVDHRDECLDDGERETKLQACVSRALPGQKIILDL